MTNYKDDIVFLNRSARNARATKLDLGKDLKRYMELTAMSQGVSLTTYVYKLLGDAFPDAAITGEYAKKMKEESGRRGQKLYGWAREFFSEKTKVMADDLTKLPLEERVELFKLMGRFNATTFWYNAKLYMDGKGVSNLSWSLATLKSLDEMKQATLRSLDEMKKLSRL